MRFFGEVFASVLVSFVAIARAPAQQLQGHEVGVSAIAFSPDGKSLASASYDGTARLWEVATGKTLQVLRGHFRTNPGEQDLLARGVPKPVLAVAFSPDGKTLATGAQNDPVRLWDVASGQIRGSIDDFPWGNTAVVSSLAFAPDGRKLAAAVRRRSLSPTGCLLVGWDLNTRKLLATMKGAKNPTPHAVFTPDGSKVALAGGGPATLFDPTTGMEEAGLVNTSPDGKHHGVSSLAISPDGTTLAAVEILSGAQRGFQYQVALWNLARGKGLATLQNQSSTIASVAFTPNGQLLACGSWDGTVKLWKVATATEQATFQWNIGPIHCVAISPDGKTLAAGGRSGTIQLWSLR